LALGLPVVDEEAVTPFAESGTLHLLVVSGLQMTLVIAAAEALLRRLLRRRPRLAACLAAGLGVGYAAAVGFSAPVWRGLLMGLAWILGRSEGWRLPPTLTLHGALLLWLLTHPAAGCEPGFLLGWWALLGLLWAAEPLAGLLRPLLGVLALTAARLLAPWLTTLPLVAIFFGGVPVWGAVANLALLPLVAVLTPLCLLLTLLPLPVLTPAVARALAWTATDLLPVFGGVRPLATAWLVPWLALALAWLALAWAQGRLRRHRALLVAALAASALLVGLRGTGRAAATLEFEAVDIGQGDALLLRAPDAMATLVDTGPSPWAARRLVKVLSRRGVKEPLRVVLTHPHADHAGGLATLARLWPLEQIAAPELRDGSLAFAPFTPKGTALAALRRGDGWRTGGLVFSVRWPPGPLDLEALGDPNAVSLVLRADWRDRQIWLMGDALDIQERDLLALGDPGAFQGYRLLKAGHHGSRSSSAPAWIEALRPALAVACAGRRNRFGHPHAETLAAFADAGLPPPLVSGDARGLRILAVARGWRVERGDGGGAFTPGAAFPAPAGAR
jgi:competence protein ComEC